MIYGLKIFIDCVNVRQILHKIFVCNMICFSKYAINVCVYKTQCLILLKPINIRCSPASKKFLLVSWKPDFRLIADVDVCVYHGWR